MCAQRRGGDEERVDFDVDVSAFDGAAAELQRVDENENVKADDGAVLKRFANGLRADANKESFLWTAEAMLTHADPFEDDAAILDEWADKPPSLELLSRSLCAGTDEQTLRLLVESVVAQWAKL